MAEQETIHGVLERIIFYNDENYFMIGEVSVEAETKSTIVITGTLPAVQCGETLSLLGTFVFNKNFGRQFKVSSFKSTLPSSVHGIRKYLGSGQIKGIGKAYAERIVKHFGADTLRIISEESARLREIPGIGEERAKAIKASWKEQSALREITIFLQTYGITFAQCSRILKAYGANAKKIVSENPFKLAKDIDGIAFPTADKIARNLGIPNESARRIDAGILYALDIFEENGNTAVPLSELLQKSAELLDVPENLVKSRIDALHRENLLKTVEENCADFLKKFEKENSAVTPKNPSFEAPSGTMNPAFWNSKNSAGTTKNLLGNELLQNSKQAKSEIEIAESLAKILAGTSSLPPIKIEAAADWAEKNAGFEFAPEQRNAVKIAISEKFSIITGGPGTGKTTILNAICSILRAKKVRITLAAPTGRAAQRMTEATGILAGTIHRILKPEPLLGGFAHNENFPLETDFLVVDEASMLDNNLAASLLKAVPESAHVVFVGDIFQLPSVGAGNVLGDLIASKLVAVTTLSAIFRQGKHSGIVSVAHAILRGERSVPEPRQLSVYEFSPERDLHFIEANSQEDCAKKVVELAAGAIPRILGISSSEEIQILSPMHKGEAGVQNLNANLQKKFVSKNPAGTPKIPAGGGVFFCVGDKVLQNKNNYDKSVFNGDLGKVETISADGGGVFVRFGNELVNYEKSELSELQLAYAITIHKSQGSEFPIVIIPLVKAHFMMLQRNLIYTAITRGRKKVFIVGEPAAFAMAVRNVDSSRRITGLSELLKKI